jgi:hypothetical protein
MPKESPKESCGPPREDRAAELQDRDRHRDYFPTCHCVGVAFALNPKGRPFNEYAK